MATTIERMPALSSRETRSGDAREALRRALLACGVASCALYVGMHEVAATRWEGYSRVTNAISELSLPGAPSRPLLVPWLFLLYNALLLALGIGVWRSARGKKTVRAIGALLTLSGATGPFWHLLGDLFVAHVVLSAISVSSWAGALALGGFTFGRWFRVYSFATLAAMGVFFGLAFAYVPAVAAGEPAPWMGLYERLAFSAFFLWVTALVAMLWPEGRRLPA